MQTTTIRHPAHYHVTIMRSGSHVSVRAANGATLATATCGTAAAARELYRNTVRSWRAVAS